MHLPQSIKRYSWAIAALWFGWGIVEAFFPAYISSFSDRYITSGLLNSTFDIVYLLMLPFIGMLADTISSKKLLMYGFMIYPVVAIGYFLGGMTGITWVVIGTLAINAVGSSMYNIARDTHFRRAAPKDHESTAFGYSRAITEFWWIIAVLIGILLVPFVPLHWLFLAIIPGALVAMLFTNDVGHDHDGKHKLKKSFFSGYRYLLKEMRRWDINSWMLAAILFLLGFAGVIAGFFIPVYAYKQGESLRSMAIITSAFAVPALLGVYLGGFADKMKKGALLIGLGLLAVLLAALFLDYGLAWKAALVFLISVVSELLGLAVQGIGTRITPPKNYGRFSSAISVVGTLGSIIGAVIIGGLIDMVGMQYALLSLGACTALLFSSLLSKKILASG
jgi:MFS family permease